MKVFQTRNVQQILPYVLYDIKDCGVKRDSRNGPVYLFPEPVTTVYNRPAERVMYWASRDCNPFFHLIESLWMLAGRNDVEPVAQFVQNIRNYSDDGVTFHGAYGYRWRHHFGQDQLSSIIGALKENKDCRRQVLDMWDSLIDLGHTGKDVPCNLTVVFQVGVDGRLDMSVFNRSNDIVWGAYGANAVHFSYLHEYVARCIGVDQGKYYQISTNFHVYENVMNQVEDLATEFKQSFAMNRKLWCPYENGAVKPYPLMQTSQEVWDSELEMFFEDPFAIGYTEPFFKHVAIPMLKAHQAFKQINDPNRFQNALDHIDKVRATDWQAAAGEWVVRRWNKFIETKKAQDNGVNYQDKA